MVVRKRSKLSRLRGSHTHGWGNKKKHRGAGHRGGRGNAGRGKHADHRRPSYAVKRIFLGHKGFFPHGQRGHENGIDIEFLAQHIGQFVQQGVVEKKSDVYIVNLEKLGYRKVLGSGTISVKMKITADSFSQKAEEKIKGAGGEVVKRNPEE